MPYRAGRVIEKFGTVKRNRGPNVMFCTALDSWRVKFTARHWTAPTPTRTLLLSLNPAVSKPRSERGFLWRHSFSANKITFDNHASHRWHTEAVAFTE